MWPALDDGSSSSVTGVLLVLLAVTCYGFAANVSVPLQQEYGPLPVVFRSQLLALAMTAPFGIFGLGRSHFAWNSTAAVAALGALGTGVAFIAMGTLLGARRRGAWRGRRLLRADRRRHRRCRVPRRARRRARRSPAWRSSSSARCSRAGRIGARPPCLQTEVDRDRARRGRRDIRPRPARDRSRPSTRAGFPSPCARPAPTGTPIATRLRTDAAIVTTEPASVPSASRTASAPAITFVAYDPRPGRSRAPRPGAR